MSFLRRTGCGGMIGIALLVLIALLPSALGAAEIGPADGFSISSKPDAHAPPFGASVRVVDDTSGAAQWEVAAAVNKRGAIVAEWVDMRSPGERCAYSSSRDGGATWQANGFRINPAFNIAADPTVATDANGDFYMLCMSVASGYNGGDIEVSRSTDDGLTWGPWVEAYKMASGGFPDKPWMTAHGNGLVYIAWEVYLLNPPSYTIVQFISSNDGGLTWTAPKNLSAGGALAELGVGIDTDSAGTIFLSWAGYSNLPVKFVKSTDGGTTFSPAVTVGANPMATTISSLAVDGSGQHVYVVWNSAYNPEGVHFSRSSDGGATWSTPVPLSPNGHKVSIDVDTTGKVHVVWEEDGAGAAEVWYSNSTDNGATFSPKSRVPDQQDKACGSGTPYGSYEAIVSDASGAVYAFWCDTRGGNADIYFAKSGLQGPQLARIVVAPDPATVSADSTLRFNASGQTQNGTPVPITPAWSVNGSGSIDSTGLFTPDKVGTSTVSAKQGTVTGTAIVTVTHGAAVKLAVTPSPATITADQTLKFTAEAEDAKGNRWTVANPTWAVVGGAGAGSIDASGLYRPDKVGTYAVEATDPSNSMKGSASVTVVAGAVVSVALSPATASITADDTQQFTASALDAKGNPVPTTFAWTAGSGAVSPSGLYTPQKTGSWTLTATAGGNSAQSTIDVAPGSLVRIALTPAAATITADDTQQFDAKGFDAKDNERVLAAGWSHVGSGDLSTAGLFAPDKVGVVTVKVSEGGVEATAKLTVTPGKLAVFRVSPTSAELDKGKELKFALELEDAKGNEVTADSVDWEISGDELGSFDKSSMTLKTRNAGEAVFRATVSAAGVKKGAESTVLVKGGLLDAKGGGQLYPMIGVLAAVVGTVVASLVLLGRRRRRAREAVVAASNQQGPWGAGSEWDPQGAPRQWSPEGSQYGQGGNWPPQG